MVLATDASAGKGRFRDIGYGGNVWSQTVYYYDYYTDQYSCEQNGYYYGWWWDAWTWNPIMQSYGACYASYSTQPYIYASESLATGDLVFWMKGSGVSFTALLLAQPGPIHSGVCSQGYGNCSYLWNNTAVFGMPNIPSGIMSGACSSIDDFTWNLAPQLASLTPGNQWISPTARPETTGTPYLFRPTQQAVDAFNAYSFSSANYGANYGGANRYDVGGAFAYSSNSVCSESVSSAFGMTCQEGGRQFSQDLNTSYGVAQRVYDNVFTLCREGHTLDGGTMPGWGGIPGGARFCISQGGRDGICAAMGRSAVNAVFGNRWARRSDFWPSVHAVSGTTVTPHLFAVLTGQADTPACPAGGNSGGSGELGRIGMWWGKVNVHAQPGGAWSTDSDCSSGANLDPLAYCRKFWPGTGSVQQVSLSSKPTPVWNSAGCWSVDGGNGQTEYACKP